MVKIRKISVIAAVIVLTALLLPFFSPNARASQISGAFEAEEILDMVQSNEGKFKAALIDADFYESENGCLAHIQEELLLNDLQDMADKIQCNIGIIIVHDLHGTDPERLIREFEKREFDSSANSAVYMFMNLHDNEEYINKGYTDRMLFSNDAYDYFSPKTQQIFEYVQEGMKGEANPYFGASMNFGKALVRLYNDPDADLDAPEEKPAVNDPEKTPVNNQITTTAEAFAKGQTKRSVFEAALLDADFFSSEDGCLTASQEKELLELMSQTADKIKCNVGVIITNESWGKSDTGLVKEFHQKMFGEYSDSITLLMFNSHGVSKYSSFQDRIYYTDRGYDLFNRRLDNIFDRLYVPIDKDPNDLYGACESFCAAITWYGSGFGEFLTKFNISGTSVFMSAVIGAVVSIIAVNIITKGYKKKTPISASHYIDTHRTRINRQVDQFVREYTTSVRISSSSGGGHGGGGGGGHRSGGGGGRHR